MAVKIGGSDHWSPQREQQQQQQPARAQPTALLKKVGVASPAFEQRFHLAQSLRPVLATFVQSAASPVATEAL